MLLIKGYLDRVLKEVLGRAAHIMEESIQSEEIASANKGFEVTAYFPL